MTTTKLVAELAVWMEVEIEEKSAASESVENSCQKYE